MNFYTYKKQWKVALFLIAIIIGVASLSYTNNLVNKMKIEEHKRMEIWAEATRYLASDDMSQDVSFYLKFISQNTTIPVILPDGLDSIISSSNLRKDKATSKEIKKKRLEKMKIGRDEM